VQRATPTPIAMGPGAPVEMHPPSPCGQRPVSVPPLQVLMLGEKLKHTESPFSAKTSDQFCLGLHDQKSLGLHDQFAWDSHGAVRSPGLREQPSLAVYYTRGVKLPNEWRRVRWTTGNQRLSKLPSPLSGHFLFAMSSSQKTRSGRTPLLQRNLLSGSRYENTTKSGHFQIRPKIFKLGHVNFKLGQGLRN
jgi:hypothetical protein